MANKIFIGNFDKGLTQNRLPFFIDNNSFPTMYNFYTWRGRAKRKRGTEFLGRLAVQVSLSSTLSSGAINLFTYLGISQTTQSIESGSISFTVGANTYLEPAMPDGKLYVGSTPSGTINYATGAVTISGGGSSAITGTFSYYTGLPVMGLEDYLPIVLPSDLTVAAPYPQLLAFDTLYSYQNFTTSSLGNTSFFNVNYFKNVPNGTYNDGTTAYVAKSAQTPFTWQGTNYQQFWTTNFEQALWATNGNPGIQIQAITAISYVSATSLTLTITSSPAVKGDFIFINEVTGTNSNTVNGQTGYVSAVGTGTITVIFPYASISNQSYSGGIVQYLTNVVSGQGDGIKWYDGDPTASSGLPSASAQGWVNFAPPLSQGTQIIDNYPSLTGPFYLVGCKAVLPYKDRIIFFGCYITTSAAVFAGTKPIYLQDAAIWSWNGSPYYTCSFNGPITPATTFNSILTPGTKVANVQAEGAAANAFYVDQTGFGGYLAAGIQQQIVTVGLNEDVLIVSFTGKQTRFVYTGNDIDPFRFYSINSELGASATFSAITLDRGVITFGTYGFAMTTQNSTQRIDLVIPDQAFDIQSTNYGVNRVNSARDFYKEWLYFSYPYNDQPSTSLFPTQTFFYNYRDNTWGIFYENFTHHGSYWRSADITWATLPYNNWDEWTDPWNTPGSVALFPSVVAGNPQGFVVVKGQGTGESPTGNIQALSSFASLPPTTQIESTNHCVQVNDYLFISGIVGPVSYNSQIGRVTSVVDANNFVIDLDFDSTAYEGLGVYTRLSQPLLQSKQFPTFWEMGRKTRIGTQQYLFDTTANAQVTCNLYLSQDPDDAFNMGPIVPNDEAPNNTLIYSQIIYTCPESTNIGLTPANTNLQMPTAINQRQIWHRMNTSLIGDTVQFGITLNDAQMRNLETATAEITLHAACFDVSPSQLLS